MADGVENMDKRKSSIKVGLMADWKAGELLKPFRDAATLAFEDAIEDGMIDRPVELIERDIDGLPTGSTENVLRAWKELAAEGVVAIIGPHISENAIALRHYIETEGRIPSIGWPGTDRWQGPWTFALNQGSLVEEGSLIANFLAHRGAKKVATVTENTAIGAEYLAFLQKAAKLEGVRLIDNIPISQVAEDLAPVVAALKTSGADAIVYCGFGVPINRLANAMRGSWSEGKMPLVVFTTGFLTTPWLEGGMRACQGMYGVDLYDESNPLTGEFADRFEARFGYRSANYYTVTGYDIAAVVARGIAYAHPLSPEGVKEGMEQVKYMPAVSGGPRTLISYGPYVRRGWMGPDYLIIREAIDAEGDLWGTLPSKFAHRMTPRTRAERKALRHVADI